MDRLELPIVSSEPVLNDKAEVFCIEDFFERPYSAFLTSDARLPIGFEIVCRAMEPSDSPRRYIRYAATTPEITVA